MDIDEMRSRPHLSFSGLSTYTDCGLLYKLARIDNLKPEFTPDSLAFGSAVHQVLADQNESRRQRYSLTPDDLTNLFEGYWKEKAEGNESISYRNGKDFTALLAEGKNLIRGFCENQVDSGYTVLSVEEPFEFTIDGIDVPIIGITDLIEEDSSGTIIITDYKTASRSFGTNDINNSFQMSLYFMAAKHNGYKDREIVLKIDALIKTKVPKVETYYTARSDIDEQRAVKKIRAIWNGIQKGVFVPNDTGFRCTNCSYKRHCDDWFGGQP